MSDYRLTKEGEKYLEKGLPEKNLLDILEKGPLAFQDARNKVEGFPIAIQWVKKKKLVDIKDGKIVLVKKVELDEQLGLSNVKKGKEIDEKVLEVLIERKLVEKISHDVEQLAKDVEGKEIQELTPKLIATGLWKKAKGFKSYDKKAVPSKRVFQGKPQPYRQIINDVRQKLIGLGFVETRGPYVESEFWNFDTLFIPQNHPARTGAHDSFNVKSKSKAKLKDDGLVERVKATHEFGWTTGSKGWGSWSPSLAKNLVLRTHNTPVSSRTLSKLEEKDLPHKMFTIDRVFRRDVIDSSHLIDFDQCEGIVVGEGLSFDNLLGYLKEIGKMFGAEQIKFKPSYFPFTEPSVEIYAQIKGHGWVEIGGAGIMRPEVTVPLGIDVPVLAWGIGIGRLAMLKLGITDIRDLYSEDMKWLREKSLVR